MPQAAPAKGQRLPGLTRESGSGVVWDQRRSGGLTLIVLVDLGGLVVLVQLIRLDRRPDLDPARLQLLGHLARQINGQQAVL